MRLASLFVSDVQGDFEGGTSLDVSWNDILRRAVEKVLNKIRPKTLVRQVQIFGGLTGSLVYYYSPTDVLVPNAIYDNTGVPLFAYRPPKAFNDKQWEQDVFTIETVNGVQMLKIRRELASGALVVEECDEIGTISGTVTPTVNEFNYLTGSGALQATFTDAGLYYGDTFATAIDITDYLQGLAIVPFSCSDVSKIASMQLQLRTDGSNYITLNSTTDSIGDNFRNGWNFARFSIANRVTTGSPTITNITEWRLIITATTGQSIVVIVDKITLQLASLFYFEYISTKGFVDGTTNAWQDTVTYTEDYVNFDRDLWGILHAEMCLIVDQQVTKRSSKANTAQTAIFASNLKAEYDAYYAKFPSQEEPLSYSISPDIALNDDYIGAPVTYQINDQSPDV